MSVNNKDITWVRWPVLVYLSEISENFLGNFLIISRFSKISLLFLYYFYKISHFLIISR